MKTRRRNDLPFPHVWRRFSRTTGSGETLKFKIQDCPEEMYDDLMDFMIKYFMRDETWNKALGIGDEELAIKEFTQMQSSLFTEKLVLICLSDDGIEYDLKINKPKILGFSLMTPVHIDDPPRDLVIKSKAISKLFEMFGEMDKHNDIFERYNVKEYLGDAGLSVGPDARGLGLGKELLMGRIDVAKSLGLKVIEATFTSHISQGLAEKCGFETVADVPYREFEKTMDFDFKTVSESIKIMAYVVK